MRFIYALVVIIVISTLVISISPKTESNSAVIGGLQYLQNSLKNLPTIFSDESKPKPETNIYQYQDPEGNWHFNNQAPKDGVESQTMTYRSDTNIVPPVSNDMKPDEQNRIADRANGDDEPSPLSPFAVFTEPGKIKKLFQDANNIEQKLSDRQKSMDQAIQDQR